MRRCNIVKGTVNNSPALPTSKYPKDGYFKMPKAKQARAKSAADSVPALSLRPYSQQSKCLTILLSCCFAICNFYYETGRNNSRSSVVNKKRIDSSLGLLTKRFLNLVQNAENGILDLNQASIALSVQKRRIYDITNVLGGIGLLTKISANNIQWKGFDDGNKSKYMDSDRFCLKDLEYKENKLDEVISSTSMFLFIILY